MISSVGNLAVPTRIVRRKHVWTEAATTRLLAFGAAVGGPPGRLLSAAAKAELLAVVRDLRRAGVRWGWNGTGPWDPPVPDRLVLRELLSAPTGRARLQARGRGARALPIRGLGDVRDLDAMCVTGDPNGVRVPVRLLAA